MYTVNGLDFNSYLAAVKHASGINACVIQKDNGLTRWTPLPKKAVKKQVRHILVKADGTEVEFSKVRRFRRLMGI